MKKFKLSLFIFRRDLRIYDNTALNKALKESEQVFPLFVFDDNLLSGTSNYHSIKILRDSLEDLEIQISRTGASLQYLKGKPVESISKLHKKLKFEAIFVNEDYSPYSVARDNGIRKWSEINNVKFFQKFDQLLFKPGSILNQQKKPYKVFTSFYKKALEREVQVPANLVATNFSKQNVDDAATLSVLDQILADSEVLTNYVGGRLAGLKILKNIGDYDEYEKVRDYPSKDFTTHLSIHLKYGTVSIREVFDYTKDKLGKEHELIRQLVWRDFYYHIAYFFPDIWEESFNKKYRDIKWENNKKLFKKWKEGRTGFPIIDAGMRELNQTGFMHNRVRMLVASFLIKDLLIDWRWGEDYFASKLVDHDPVVNNGNWQWVAGTGVDSSPYFRIFNPWTQQKKFDKDARYIKRWVPELKDIEPKEIHTPDADRGDYTSPIVDHEVRRKGALELYKVSS